MPHSHHSHSGQFCAHAKGTLDEVVRAAIDKGFHTYGLSEHCPRYRDQDLYPEETAAGLDHQALTTTYELFLKEAHRLRVLYASSIDLLVGIETEYITELDLQGTAQLLARSGDGCKIDYVVGSVHHVNEIPIDFDEPTFERAIASFGSADAQVNTTAFLCSYFDNQYELMTRLKPQVIGHFDLCRLYRPNLKFEEYESVWEKIKRNVDYGVEYGALFELNAAAFRKGWETSYPGPDVLNLIIQSGGRLCLSDDSHGPQAVGLNYHRLPGYLEAAGVKELWYLKRVTNSDTSKVEACRYENDWALDPFWTIIQNS
ncbi:histidinol phosphate phosphatase H [Dacryopinax primogenitus]|uniref:Histidinol-phosphatase n=1 Tax=Dacryopinax primogenitus (strain DJM 731) TaxID=1858805 RepID=M5FYM5_DACPD|nr:histidinol phosphate phosphatase H [Dacryopinax primogenitus]EJU01619.1 histidinol phosphate phosphatase H [Dacryopinax primogenitus]